MTTEPLAPPRPEPSAAPTDSTPGDQPTPGAEQDGAASRARWRRLVHPFVVMPVVAVLAVGGWWLFGRSDGTTSTATAFPAEQVVAVTTGPLDQTISADGTIEAAATDELSFSASGTVTAVNVKAGDQVIAGQVLATIDSSELEAAVSEAESNLAQAQAKYADDRSAGASSAQLSADATSVTTAQDSLTAAEEALAGASLVATIDGTVSTVDLTVGEKLGSSGGGTDTTGTDSGSGGSSSNLGSSSTGPTGPTGSSGTDGSSSDSSSGSSAQITVVSSGSFRVELAVDSADIADVAVGQSVSLTVSSSSSSSPTGFPGGFPGGAQAFAANGATGADSSTSSSSAGGARTSASGAAGSVATGTVTEVGAVADASSGVASFPVTVTFTAPADEFFAGATVTAEIVTQATGDVLQVQSMAVTTASDGTTTVLLSTDGTAEHTREQVVTTGTTSNGMIEITSGLAAGDQVVIRRTFGPGAVPGAGSGPSGSPPADGAAPTGAVTGAGR